MSAEKIFEDLNERYPGIHKFIDDYISVSDYVIRIWALKTTRPIYYDYIFRTLIDRRPADDEQRQLAIEQLHEIRAMSTPCLMYIGKGVTA